MPLLSTAPRTTTSLAPPLPVNNGHLSKHGVVLRRRQFSLLAAAPSVGKSLMASNLVAHCKAGTLFFSADSDEWTVKTRCVSILTGYPLEQVDKWLSEGGKTEEALYRELGRLDHVDWCFNTAIDLEFLMNRVLAYAEVRGDYPELVIVDNLGNMVSDPSNPWTELSGICYELQAMARTTGSHILGLCHVVGAKENGLQPIALGDLLGKVGKVPEIVLGLNWVEGDEGNLNLTVAKNRGGRRTPSGFHIPVDYSKGWIGGWQ